MTAVSQQSTERMSPWDEQPVPSVYQATGRQRQQQGTSSPAERSVSRLDISKLQQRSNAAAASHTLPGSSANSNGRPLSSIIRSSSGGDPGDSPQLAQPRPGLPAKTLSEISNGVGALPLGLSAERLTFASPLAVSGVHYAGNDTLNTSVTSDFSALKPDGYAFPVTRPPSASPVTAPERVTNDSSRASHHSPRRIVSPHQSEQPPRFRLSSYSSTPARASTPSPSRMIDSSETMCRLASLETAMVEMIKGLASVARNVGWLMEKQKERERSPADTAALQNCVFRPVAGHADDVRALSHQLGVLSNNVQQLMALQQQQKRASGQALQQGSSQRNTHSQVQMGGLGLGLNANSPSHQLVPSSHGQGMSLPPQTLPGTPLSTFPEHSHSALSPLATDRSVSPGVGGPYGLAGGSGMHAAPGPSPRPGQSIQRPPSHNNWTTSPGGDGYLHGRNDRRWNSALPSPVAALGPRRESVASGGPNASANSHQTVQDLGSSNTVTATEANAVVTKWEHLNLHSDLLRSVLKYGLGPPNKIQQRALPFLLRGSDIIAQAPPTQERIASYVIPALQCVLNVLRGSIPNGSSPSLSACPIVIMVTTTVDQATQAQRMALGLGSHLGVRVHIAAGGTLDSATVAQALVQTSPHIVVGTPTKMSDLLTLLAASPLAANSVDLACVRMIVLDEVDQMIARNLSDHIGTILRALPSSTPSRELTGFTTPETPGVLGTPALPASLSGRFSPFAQPSSGSLERQTAIFSNTVPQDVLNFAQSIHLRESVRVLIRREGTSVTQHPPSGGQGSTIIVSASGAPPPSTSAFSLPMSHSSAVKANQHGASWIAGKQQQCDSFSNALLNFRHFYLCIAVSDARLGAGLGSTGLAPSSSTEMKLDVITDLLEDVEFNHAIIYTGSLAALEAVTYKLASKGIEVLALRRDMALSARQQVLANFRSPMSSIGSNANSDNGRQRKALVAFDVSINPREVHQVPLILFYDLPRTIAEYKDKLACASTGGMSRPSVCVNVVTNSGNPTRSGLGLTGDIEMLKAIEAHLGCQMMELPLDAKTLLNF